MKNQFKVIWRQLFVALIVILADSYHKLDIQAFFSSPWKNNAAHDFNLKYFKKLFENPFSIQIFIELNEIQNKSIH